MTLHKESVESLVRAFRVVASLNKPVQNVAHYHSDWNRHTEGDGDALAMSRDLAHTGGVDIWHMSKVRLQLEGRVFSDMQGVWVPKHITTASGMEFTWDEETGSYEGEDGTYLYMEEYPVTEYSHYEVLEK